jgi:transcriptional antiterminator RfaH
MPKIGKTDEGWFCFKALPKKEHIAAELLRRKEGLETLCPRFSYMKKTRRGNVRYVECLFPGYVFVRANLVEYYRRIRATQGIRDIVSFGDRVPLMPDSFIEQVRAQLGEAAVKDAPPPEIQPGQEVIITEGPFQNLKAMVTGEMDSTRRVALLLEFLGRQMEIRVAVDDLQPDDDSPAGRVWES